MKELIGALYEGTKIKGSRKKSNHAGNKQTYAIAAGAAAVVLTGALVLGSGVLTGKKDVEANALNAVGSTVGAHVNADNSGSAAAGSNNSETTIETEKVMEEVAVRQEILEGTYKLDTDVDIAVLTNYKALYKVGSGRLKHDAEGFHLTGCDGKLDYTQSPVASHCLNADYFWYEIGDIISIGNSRELYYCFPRKAGDFVAKTRFAAEEMYKLYKGRRQRPTEKQVAPATKEE